MDIFEYLPQLIVAYDGNDEFANLIHVKKANKDNNYLCPCCGGNVKPRALNSTKEQSHYYHITGKCTNESQLHFFCKNWLFEKGSKFYIGEDLFEVDYIEVEKQYDTPFGKYIPDITVHTTSNETIYFEMFFTNRKTGDDYFCKWDYLGNDVVEVDIKEYMFKTEKDVVPVFKYLYHDGVCNSKPYVKRDLYANTIAKIKRELTRQKVLDYRARIERLDWFWQKIINNESRENILSAISTMDYDDMVSCYSIIKRKQCVSYLKDDVLNMINQRVISEVRSSLDLPYDENVYFDLKQIHSRTYEAGIRLKIKTNHITYDNIYKRCDYGGTYYFDKLNGYPRIVFKKNILTVGEISIPCKRMKELHDMFDKTVEYKNRILEIENELSEFEGDDYKIKSNNNEYTVLAKIHNDGFEVLLDNYFMPDFNKEKLLSSIQRKLKEIKDKEYLNGILENEECHNAISSLQNYKGTNCTINIKYDDRFYDDTGVYLKAHVYTECIYNKKLEDNFDECIEECKNELDKLIDKYSTVIGLVDKINNCKNKFWKAKPIFRSRDNLSVEIDQLHINAGYTHEHVDLQKTKISDEEAVKSAIKNTMIKVINNMEKYGYRVMEVSDAE